MNEVRIPRAALERNRAWIKAVTGCIDKRGGGELSREAMRDTGTRRAELILGKVTAHYGRVPQSADELIEAINRRRVELLKKTNLWRRDGERAHFHLDACGCDLVGAGLGDDCCEFTVHFSG